MTENPVLFNLVLILAATAVGGGLAIRLKQPIIVGYLLAGIIVGPFTPGPRADFEQMRALTEVGLGLLLFVLGASMSPASFRGLGRVILLGGTLQIALSIGLGILLMPVFGLNLSQGILLGVILAQSSSAVIARVLDDRRDVDTPHGRIAIGISIVQDLSSLPLLLLLLVFFGERENTLLSLAIAAGQVFVLVIFTYIIGKLVWPRALGWFGRMGSDELTLLVALGLALGGGLLMQMVGLSFALGSFIAGLVIAESPYRPKSIARILPLRDVFAAVFFVSIGALFDISVIWNSTLPLLGILLALILGKGFTTAFILKRLGQGTSTAILAGLLLAQLGEFAFILANIGLERGAFSHTLFSVIIGAAVISILVNSLILDSAPPVMMFLARVTRFRPLTKQPRKIAAGVFKRRGISSEKITHE